MAKSYALITGASSGIGESIARQLAAKGHHLILTARRLDRLEHLAAELSAPGKVDIQVVASDLSQPGAAKALHATVLERGLHVNMLINNAGVGIQGKFMDMDLDRVEAMCRLNMEALTVLTQAFGRDMAVSGGGHILQVASMAAFQPSPYVAAYAATKAYVLSFSEAVAYELRGTKVSITTLYPGITTTEFGQVAGAETPSGLKATILSADDVARFGIKAMFARRRAVVPGFLNNLTSLFLRVMPRGFIIRSAGSLMGKANHH